jgi:carboxymethylenebutenolidase
MRSAVVILGRNELSLDRLVENIMCDEKTNKDAEAWLRRRGLTRRDFNKGGAAAALTMLLPPVANALDVTEEDVLVDTPDGKADCYFVHPASGSHAGVIVWPDVKGIRPAFRAMGKRLAQSGYSVLVVNPYYRTHQGRIINDGESYRDPDVRERIMPHRQSLSPETCVIDGKAFVTFLDRHASVDTGRKIGTTGYCMTGSYTMRLAAAIPDRIGAGGSFHGGGLATDAEDSPHLLVPQMKAGFLIAIAESDDKRDPEDKHLLREAFDAAGVAAEIEVYEGTAHGWCPPDSEVYDEAQADRAWSRLLALFERELA